MTIRILALNATESNSQTLGAIAVGIHAAYLPNASTRDVAMVLSSEYAACPVVFDPDDGAQGLQILETFPFKPPLASILIAREPSISVAVRAGKLGVLHFFRENTAPEIIGNGLQDAINQEAASQESRRAQIEFNKRFRELSAGEEQVVRWVLYGVSNKLIARQVKVSQRTVESRRQKVFKKLGMGSVAELVRVMSDYVDLETLRPEGLEQVLKEEDDNRLDVAS
jgi:FixJ family two-component response regulator